MSLARASQLTCLGGDRQSTCGPARTTSIIRVAFLSKLTMGLQNSARLIGLTIAFRIAQPLESDRLESPGTPLPLVLPYGFRHVISILLLYFRITSDAYLRQDLLAHVVRKY